MHAYPKLKHCKLPGKRHESQGLQTAGQTSHSPRSGCKRTRSSRIASCQATQDSLSSGCKRTRSSRTASCQANVTNLKNCKLPGERHILQALVASVPEAQGLQASRQTSDSGRRRWRLPLPSLSWSLVAVHESRAVRQGKARSTTLSYVNHCGSETKQKENVANHAGGWFTSNNRGTYGTPAVLQSIVGTHINGPGMLLVHEKR